MKAALLGTGGGDGDNGGADNLSDVTLDFFTATPTGIGPFDSSTLAWHVSGVTPTVRIFLDNSQLGGAGSAIVQPAVTTGYMLSAASGQARKTLGEVTVEVDRSTCDEVEIINILTLLREQLIIGINRPSDPQTYWVGSTDDPKTLSVTLSNAPLPRIYVHMYFHAVVPHWYLPNANVTLDLSFGLGVKNGAFISVVPASSASVDEGFLGWLVGFPLGIALAMASSDAQGLGFVTIEKLVNYINVVEVQPSFGKAVRSAVVEYRNGKPFIGYVECGLGNKGATVIWSEILATAALQVSA